MSHLPSYDDAVNENAHEDTTATQLLSQCESIEQTSDNPNLKLKVPDLEAAKPPGSQSDDRSHSEKSAPNEPKGRLFCFLKRLLYVLYLIVALLFCTGIWLASRGRLCESPQLTIFLFTPGTVMVFKGLEDYMIKEECFGLGVRGRKILASLLMWVVYCDISFAVIELGCYCNGK